MRILTSFAALSLILACGGSLGGSAVQLETPYHNDRDLQPDLPFDGDQTYVFHADGSCELTWESIYDCTWEPLSSGGVTITAFTGARDPDGNPHAVTDMEAPMTLKLNPESLLIGPDGRRFLRQD